jgi:hypothetical protein
MKTRTVWIAAALAVAGCLPALVGLAPDAKAAGCSAEMQSITPQHSIYDPGKSFGQDVAFTARGGYSDFGIDGVNDYVILFQGDCSGRD